MKRFLFSSLLFVFIFSSCVPSAPVSSTPTTLPSAPPTETPMPPTPTSTPEPTSTPIPSVTLRRGVNMGNMLEAPNEGEWGVFIQEEYFDLIKEAGFDFVRLPVRWNAHPDETWAYMSGTAFFTIDPAFFARVDEVVGWALKRD